MFTNLKIRAMGVTFEELQMSIVAEAKAKIRQAKHNYKQAEEDCKNGIYDKWFRYHRKDDGMAYDLGWMNQNKTTQNETVKFVRG